MNYRLSALAEAELDAIYYVGAAEFGVFQADRYAAGLIDAFRFVARFPHAMGIRSGLKTAIRVHHFKAHVIVYEVQDEEVVILSIRHGREDWLSDFR